MVHVAKILGALLAMLMLSSGALGRTSTSLMESIPGPIYWIPAPLQLPIEHVSFVDATDTAGLGFSHGFIDRTDGARVAAGVAVGDYDGDGWLDIYLVQGNIGFNKLYQNRSQNGRYAFVDNAAEAGVTGSITDKASGPAFVDYDGDGDMDLLVGSVESTPLRVFRNLGDGSFADVTGDTGLGAVGRENNIGMAFGDYDRDGDLDLFIGHWTFTLNELPTGSTQHLWRNNGNGTFSDVSDESRLSSLLIEGNSDYTFSPTFADIDNDGDLDLLVVADNETSQVLINQGAGSDGSYTFASATDRQVINEDAGMGSSVADFDNDGDLDWFVTSISLGDSTGGRPNGADNAGFNLTGNRFYRNDGSGIFSDQTDIAGVRKGYWGWGSCAADFNNDGLLDIFHVNGMDEPNTNAYLEDPSRLFINAGSGVFVESSAQLGLLDRESGRGVTCFDGDQDGDIDILIANNDGAARLFRNDGGNQFNYLNIGLRGASPNTRAVGARIYVTGGGMTQLREVANGSNYVSQNPAEQHFGLRNIDRVDNIRVVWSDGVETSRNNIASSQRIVVSYPDSWSTD